MSSLRARLILTLLFALFALPNLSARTLWQDEAETALIAQVVTKRGLPYALDEQGPISQDWAYQFSVSPLWRWHPWFQFYITAVSFKLLGVSTFAARLPFVLIGIFSYWYFLMFLKKQGSLKKFFLLAALLFLASTPIYLHFRQCRYYAPSLLFTLMAIDGYLGLRKEKQKNPVLTVLPRQGLKYILGSIGLFHSFLSGALALQIALWIHLFGQGLSSARAKVRPWSRNKFPLQFTIAFFITLPFTLPWAWWLKIGGQNINLTPTLIKQHLVQHYIYIHKFIFPFFLVLPFLLPRLRQKFIKDEKLVLFSLIIGTNLALYTINHPYFFRYLVPLIPLFIYLAAWILSQLRPLFLLLGIAVLFQMTWRTFPDYLWEITHNYYGTNEQLVEYLQKGVSLQEDSLGSLATNYHDFTLRFHTDWKVYGPQHLVDYPPLRSQLFTGCPDVVIIYPNWGNESRLMEIAQKCQLQPSKHQIPFSKLADAPSPVNHQFRPPTIGQLDIFLKPKSNLPR